jgi:hypothetical protein
VFSVRKPTANGDDVGADVVRLSSRSFRGTCETLVGGLEEREYYLGQVLVS